MPPTEKNGRRQTSELKIIVSENNSSIDSITISDNDITEEFIRTTGNGGQNRNKRESCVRLTHNPTGIQVISDGERTQAQNRAIARKRLEEKLNDLHVQEINCKNRNERNNLFNNENIWQWCEWRDEIKSPNGKKYSYKKFFKGKITFNK